MLRNKIIDLLVNELIRLHQQGNVTLFLYEVTYNTFWDKIYNVSVNDLRNLLRDVFIKGDNFDFIAKVDGNYEYKHLSDLLFNPLLPGMKFDNWYEKYGGYQFNVDSNAVISYLMDRYYVKIDDPLSE